MVWYTHTTLEGTPVSRCADRTGMMALDTKKLVTALKRKRDAEGLSLRGLSSIIGISFSTLARIERGDGEPDNNSVIRILEWLGEDGRESGLSFENVAFVHFRAAKNVHSKTIHCLLQAADILKRSHEFRRHNREPIRRTEEPSELPESNTLALSKSKMEDMAENFRRELRVKESEPLDALNVNVKGVGVFVPGTIPELSKSCLTYLCDAGSSDWSAMSVPLDPEEDRWAILRNDSHTPERQRVTYLEECWHIMLGHKLTRIAKIADAYGRTYDSSEEHDAFYLASASLLPKFAIEKSVKEKKSAEDIALKFSVSRELVEYRIKRLGLWRMHTGKEISISSRRE